MFFPTKSACLKCQAQGSSFFNYQNRFVVERDGKPVAVILSIEAYERRLLKERPLTLKETQAPYAFGLWANRDDIDEEWLADGRFHHQSP